MYCKDIRYGIIWNIEFATHEKYTLPVECSIANDDVSGNFCAAFKSLDIRVIHIVRIFEAGTHCIYEISFMIILLIQISLALKKMLVVNYNYQ